MKKYRRFCDFLVMRIAYACRCFIITIINPTVVFLLCRRVLYAVPAFVANAVRDYVRKRSALDLFNPLLRNEYQASLAPAVAFDVDGQPFDNVPMPTFASRFRSRRVRVFLRAHADTPFPCSPL